LEEAQILKNLRELAIDSIALLEASLRQPSLALLRDNVTGEPTGMLAGEVELVLSAALQEDAARIRARMAPGARSGLVDQVLLPAVVSDSLQFINPPLQILRRIDCHSASMRLRLVAID
jgi:hypothetical protein